MVERLGPTATVVHCWYKSSAGSSARDFCLLEYRTTLPDGSRALLARSVEHPRCPVTRARIRGEVRMWGLVVRPLTTTSSQIICTLHCDMRGSMPLWLKTKVNMTQAMLPLGLAKLFAS